MQPAGSYRSIVVLTGAGISAESGIRTFRDSGGLWEDHRIEDVASPEGYRRNPALVHQFYNLRRQQLLEEAVPNEAHLALAQFEQHFDGDFLLVTQNVDDLHQRAGSQRVLPMHGELLKVRCERTGKIVECRTATSPTTRCSCCQSPGPVRPHIVWFGEMPLKMDRIETALAQCDLFVAIGTSGNVYPAAGFVDAASSYGATTVELNLERNTGSSRFDHCLLGPATQTTSDFFQT